MRPAVELSYLNEDCQRDLVDEIVKRTIVPHPTIRQSVCGNFSRRQLTTEAISAIMSEEKPNQREKIVFAWGQGAKPDPEKYPHQPNGGVCLQGAGALQQVFA